MNALTLPACMFILTAEAQVFPQLSFQANPIGVPQFGTFGVPQFSDYSQNRGKIIYFVKFYL